MRKLVSKKNWIFGVDLIVDNIICKFFDRENDKIILNLEGGIKFSRANLDSYPAFFGEKYGC